MSSGAWMVHLQFCWMVSFHGRTSSRCSGCRWMSAFGRCSKRYLRYWNRFKPLALAVSMMLSTAALALAPFGESLNSQFLRPMVKLRMARSQTLFFALFFREPCKPFVDSKELVDPLDGFFADAA